MEAQNVELTVEDIMILHRGWITQLYVQDRKTEVEIVSLLYERRLLVTLAQIQRCIREWGLVQPLRSPTINDGVTSPSPTLSDDWELVSSPPKSEVITQASYTPVDPAQVSKYNEKPLPSLPIPKIHYSASKIQKRRPSTTDRLKLTCHHGPSLSDVHEVQTTLELLPSGPSPMETYTKDEQTHERIALGLKGWRRATDLPVTNRPRQDRTSRIRLRGEGMNRGGRTASFKRKPQRKEDDQERRERKKTPPSPVDEV